MTLARRARSWLTTALGLAAAVGVGRAVARWVWAAPGNAYVVDAAVRRARRRALAAGRGADAPGRPPGMLVVQLDGVSPQVLHQARAAGLVPTMDRWLRTGSHVVEPWWVRLPATTPASQAGLLYGDSSGVPGFRWWDRELGRLVVTNRPADTALVERRVASEPGLLAGGVAVSTMFTGGAASWYLVVSRGPRDVGPSAGYRRFLADPSVGVRVTALTVGEMLKELYQARRQREHGVEPRVRRGGWYVPARGLTNVALRDLSTSMVAGALEQGAPVVYATFVDYDEIAHHAGPTRPESLRALEGLDGVLGTLERMLPWAPREYQVVVLSDHGQTLGAPFEQVAGAPLLDVLRRLMASPQAAGLAAVGGEGFAAVEEVLGGLVGHSGARLRTAHGERRAHDERGRGDRRGTEPAPDGQRAQELEPEEPGAAPEVVVAASGNLALVTFPRLERRPVLEDLQGLYPGLVAGLAATPGIGLVVVDTTARGLVVVGPRGVRALERDEPAEGEDPLSPYGPRAADDLARAARLPGTGDLLVVSAVTPEGQVHSFEGQVGSHGGLGGDQSWGMLLHPTGWQVADERRSPVGERRVLVGAEAVHRQLVAWLREAGLRPDGARPGEAEGAP